MRFSELGVLPSHIQLNRLDEGQGTEAAMVIHEAKWHQTCMLQYNTTMLRRAEKRAMSTPAASDAAFLQTHPLTFLNLRRNV